MQAPTVEVRFKDLNVDAEVFVGNRGEHLAQPLTEFYCSMAVLLAAAFTRSWQYAEGSKCSS